MLERKGYRDNFSKANSDFRDPRDILRSNYPTGNLVIQVKTLAELDYQRGEYIQCTFSLCNSRVKGIYVSNLLIEHRKFDTTLISSNNLKIKTQEDIPSRTQVIHRMAAGSLKVKKNRYRL